MEKIISRVCVIFLFSIFYFLFFIFSVEALTVSPVRLEISGDPGQTLQSEIILINEGKEAQTFYSSFENFEAKGETGTPYFTPGTEGLATWIKAPSEITLEPQEIKTIPFTIEIPQNAEPGGHFAAIFWGSQPPEVKEGGQIMVGTKTGILVLLSVSGEIKGQGGILEFYTKDKKKIFTSLPISFIYRFQNTFGNRIKPEGEIKIKNLFGRTTTLLNANKIEGNVLPKSIRKFEVIWETLNNAKKIGFFGVAKKQWKDFHFGRYLGYLNLKNPSTGDEFKSSYSFFIIPWQLLTVVIIIVLIITVLSTIGVKKYNRWIISKALEVKK